MRQLWLLARAPRAGVPAVLASGRVSTAVVLVAIAEVLAGSNALRFASEVPVEEVMFGETRTGPVAILIATLGRDLAAILLHLLERAWDGVVVASALGPLFIWLLGASAIHAAARLNGVARPIGPMFVLHGYATGLMRPVGDAAALLLGPRGVGAAVAQLIGAAAIVWLGVIVWYGIRSYYGVTGGRALTILVAALVLFYVVPLALIVIAVVAIVIAAFVLEYVPAPR
ncbi:MAG: hypothetical protein HYU87_08320 [Chloroflexi bacterium]|nr:hypothetical protein [Chloroflexota bacterium]